MAKSKAPRLSDLKRALRWLRAQYQKRAEEATRGQDRTIERIRKAKAKKGTREVDCMTAPQFTNWRPLVHIALADLPNLRAAAAVYAIRSKDGEILKFGSTTNMRNRLFKNYIGGTGGSILW